MSLKKEYGDFRLELDCKLDVPGNSGIQVRSHQDKNKNGTDHIFGYQCEIDPSPRAWSAGIYEEGRRGWLHSQSLAARARQLKGARVGPWARECGLELRRASGHKARHVAFSTPPPV